MSNITKISFKKLDKNAQVPRRGNSDSNSAGYDLYSLENFYIPPLTRKSFKTGISLEIPLGMYGRIAPRSGLAVKNGIDVLAGVVDCDYRGEICVVLYNTDKDNGYTILSGERIAQIIFENYNEVEFHEVLELNETKRNQNGFGSSGL